MKLVKIGEAKEVLFHPFGGCDMNIYIVDNSTVIELEAKYGKINPNDKSFAYFIFPGISPNEANELLKQKYIPTLEGWAFKRRYKGSYDKISYKICIFNYPELVKNSDKYPNLLKFIKNKIKEAMKLDHLDPDKISNEELEEIKNKIYGGEKVHEWYFSPYFRSTNCGFPEEAEELKQKGVPEPMANLMVNTTTGGSTIGHPNKWIPIKTSKGVLYTHVGLGWSSEFKDWGLGIYFTSEERYQEFLEYFNAGKKIIDELRKDSILDATISKYCIFVREEPKYDNLLQQFKDLMNMEIESWKSVGESPSKIKNIKIKFYSGYDKIYDGKFSIEEFFNNDVPALVETILTKFPDLFNKYYKLRFAISSLKNGGARIELSLANMTIPNKEKLNLENNIKNEFINTLQKVKQQQKQKSLLYKLISIIKG